MSGTPSPQLGLPYTANDYISNRLDRDGFPQRFDPLWALNVTYEKGDTSLDTTHFGGLSFSFGI
jgi:hypothetical protein